MYNAFKTARNSVKGAFSTVSNSTGFTTGFHSFKDEDAIGGDSPQNPPLGARMAYIAVSRNEEMLAEVADREVAEDDRDFAIALGRKMLKRKAPAGWDEIAADRHNAIRFTIHDIEGCTSYTICFSHSFPADRAQAFVQKLALMLDPIIEKSATITASLIESTLLIVLPVLERELERGNSGDMSYVIENQSTEIKGIIKQNIELILDREAKSSQSVLTSRSWKRTQMTSKVKYGITLGTSKAKADETLTRDSLREKNNAAVGKGGPSPPSSHPPASAPPPSKAESKPGGSATTSASQSQEKTTPATASASKSTPSKPSKPAKAEPPPPKKSPRTEAKELVGSKLSEEQAARAADLILKLKPHMNSKTRPYVQDLWEFFEMEKPKEFSFKEGDPIFKTLKGKINRQRLLLHPDKNAHPDATETFKFLEACHQRILDTCVQKSNHETAREKTKREEEEMKKEAEKRKREEEEFAARAEQIRKEEEEKWRQESLSAQKAEFDRQRIEKMRRDQEALRQDAAERAARYRAPAPIPTRTTVFTLDEDDDEAPQALPTSGPAKSAEPPPQPHHQPEPPEEEQCPPETLVGKLTLQIIGARDLPAGGLFQETNAYCMAGVGSQKCRTKSVPGRNPKWNTTYELEVRMQDQGLFVTVWREGWGFSLLGDDFLGRVEIPFLDLDDWSGCVIGRVIESADPDADVMVLELKASIEWI